MGQKWAQQAKFGSAGMNAARGIFRKRNEPLDWAKLGKIQRLIENLVFLVTSMKMRSGNPIETSIKIFHNRENPIRNFAFFESQEP